MKALVAPTNLRDYAKSLGWSLRPEALPDRLYVLDHPDKWPNQIVIPSDASAPDYLEAVDRAISKLSKLHQVSVAQVRKSIQSVHEDTILYGITTRRQDEDSLPLSFAATFLKGVQQMLSASACTVLKPQARHSRLQRTETDQLIRSTRFGHTEEGSFVLRVSCPINALAGHRQTALPLDADMDMPFVRRATLTVKHTLERLVHAVEADTLERLVEDVRRDTRPLLSSNFCDALLLLYDESFQNNVKIVFHWAPGEPLPAKDRVRASINIQSDYFPRIEEVGREIRPQEELHDDTFIGTVEVLEGTMGEDGRRSGDVIVALLLPEGESVRARVSLSAEQYESALQAHQNDGCYVKVSGWLHSGRQPRILSDVTQFALIPK